MDQLFLIEFIDPKLGKWLLPQLSRSFFSLYCNTKSWFQRIILCKFSFTQYFLEWEKQFHFLSHKKLILDLPPQLYFALCNILAQQTKMQPFISACYWETDKMLCLQDISDSLQIIGLLFITQLLWNLLYQLPTSQHLLLFQLLMVYQSNTKEQANQILTLFLRS